MEQGTRADGSTKVRAIDHMSWSVAPDGVGAYHTRKKQGQHSVNWCTVLPESIHHDHIDLLMIVVKKFRSMFNELPGLLKADVDSAFRRIPLQPNHR